MKKPKPRQTVTVFGYSVTPHAQERFARRFRGYDLEESLRRSEVITAKYARKLTLDVPLTMGTDFYLYDPICEAVFVINEHRHRPAHYVVVTVVKTWCGKIAQ